MDPIISQIQALKQEKDAVILAHYYVPDEVQAVADYIGDSYYLSKLATTLDAKALVLCGVRFMGESAKILNPDKTVLLPDCEADCPMAHMARIQAIERIRAQYGSEVAVVCYINSTASLKCHADVCVTSSNAHKIVAALPQPYIYFIPDGNLGRHIASQLPEKHFLFNEGHCPIHVRITAPDVQAQKALHPGAPVLAHPECVPEVVALADYVGSTSGIIDYATASTANAFIICTEVGVCYELRQKNPHKRFFPARSDQVCADMKRITLQKVCDALRTGTPCVEVDEATREAASAPLLRMLALSK